MKFFKLMMIAFLAILGLNSCSNDSPPPLDFIEVDHSKDLVGTWTYIAENGQAEAMVIKEDGSFAVTGIMKGGYLYEEKGTIKVVNNKVSLVFEGDSEVFKGRLELVVGKSMSIVFNEENDIRLTYDYCKTDLSDEIIGLWVCHEGLQSVENDMAIITYFEDGKMTMTTQASDFIADDFVKRESNYKVVGDLVFKILPSENVPEGIPPYIVSRLIYTPNGTALGDILTENQYVYSDNGLVEITTSFLRVKESLKLTGKVYDYKSAYVTNAKGKDEDFTIMGNTFNIAKIKSYDFDKMFSADLFSVELNANSFKYSLRLENGQDTGFDTPMTVDGNKVTLDMSAINPALRKVEMYMFQDANDTQVHFYMYTDAFINYFANMEVYTLILEGKIDPADTAAVEKVFADMESRVESINVSFVMKVRK